MRINTTFAKQEMNFSGGIILPNTWLLRSNDNKYADFETGRKAGRFLYKKSKDDIVAFSSIKGWVVTFVPQRLAYTPFKNQLLSAGEMPFCASMVEDTSSLRYDKTAKEYVPGPPCTGNEEQGIEPCPFLTDGICSKAYFIYIVTEDETLLKYRTGHPIEAEKFEALMQKTPENKPIQMTTEKITFKNGKQGFQVLYAPLTEKLGQVDLALFTKRAEEEVEEVLKAQRGETINEE